MERFTVELTAANRCGVLNRIIGIYTKRKYNIDSMTVTETSDPELSVIRIASQGGRAVQDQLTRQLQKLFDVKTVVLSNDPTR